MSRKILVAVDLGDQSFKVFEAAKSAAQEGDQLLLVHVVADPARMGGLHVPHISTDKTREELIEDARGHLDRFTGRYARGVPFLVKFGIPHKEILAAAKEEKADLIVIGRRQGGGAFVPSTAKNVLLKAECDVKAVKLPNETEQELRDKPKVII